MDFVYFEDNFIEGSKNWVKKFKDEDERILMLEYVNFCRDVIYANYYGPYATEGHEKDIVIENFNNTEKHKQQLLSTQNHKNLSMMRYIGNTPKIKKYVKNG